jgi:hypothetical protein
MIAGVEAKTCAAPEGATLYSGLEQEALAMLFLLEGEAVLVLRCRRFIRKEMTHRLRKKVTYHSSEADKLDWSSVS